MKTGFAPIQLDDYVELHLRANPDAERTELIRQLQFAIAARRAGTRCRCEAPEWIIGSAHAGLGCFTCITGQEPPDQDYEVEVAEDPGAGPRQGSAPPRLGYARWPVRVVGTRQVDQ